MASDDSGEVDEDLLGGYDDNDGPVSPTSAADLLRRKSRGRTSLRPIGALAATATTSTPGRRTLFPANINDIAPGMTPTSRSHRRTRASHAASSPQRPGQATPVRLSKRQRREEPELSSEEEPTTYFREQRTPRRDSIENNAIQKPSQTPRRASPVASVSSSSSSVKGKQRMMFAGWGAIREESPMEMLRLFARAPGSVASSVDYMSVHEDDDGDDKVLPELLDLLSERDGVGDDARAVEVMNEERAGDTSRIRRLDSSFAMSEAGQARRKARQSMALSLFSEAVLRDVESDEATRYGDLTEKVVMSPILHVQDESDKALQTLGDAFVDEPASERSLSRADSSRQMPLDTSERTTSVVSRLSEEVDMSMVSSRSRVSGSIELDAAEGDEEQGNDGDDTVRNTTQTSGMTVTGGAYPANDSFPSNSDLAQDSRSSLQFQPGEQLEDSGEVMSMSLVSSAIDERPVDDSVGEVNMQELSEESDETSDSGDSVHPLDDSKALHHAQAALLRKRMARKKAKRYSDITGNEVPSLPPKLVSSLFSSFCSQASGSGPNAPKSKVKVDKGALETVEDISHHFFGQFVQTLVKQGERRSRTAINEQDVVELLTMQGQITARNPLDTLARKFLPRELSDLITSAESATTSSRKRAR